MSKYKAFKIMSKYKAFKNYLHNDLKISKTEIQDIIREEVSKQVIAVMEGRDGENLESRIEGEIRRQLVGKVRSDTICAIIENLKENIKVSVTMGD